MEITHQNLDWIESLNNVVPPWLYVPAAVLLWILSLWLVKKFIVYRLKKWAASTTAHWDDILIDSISFPANFLILASGLTLLIQLLPMPDKVDRGMLIVLQGSVIISIVCFLDGLAKGLLEEYASKKIFNQVSHGLTKGLVRGFVIGMGVLIFLQLIGISITPILASLGIGSLAVALALQDTLSNFFAGIYVAVDKPVEVGQLIKLETGEEGYVIEVGWRSTRIRTLQNNVVIIPNSKLMGSVITNYHLLDKEMVLTVEVGVHYHSDLNHVEKVTLEVAREAMKKTLGGVPEFQPIVRLHTFGESSVNFSVVLRAKEFVDHYTVKHEFIKMLHERFRKEGIVIPYPIRNIVISRPQAEKSRL